ncbi:hypothetical protein B484DRAFT_444794 [Ochromonadaceae sp. CCMP2298]|nr:hypothetical protein B484DRAFT_444794 [Ochromonadaceae sp. CCMP2298]
MQLQTALLLALACIAHSKLDVPEFQLETIIDSMTSMAAAVPAFTAHPGRIVDGKSVANGLEQSCNNKFCSMMYYASSCKAIGLDVSKICMSHLLGFKYACPIFPPPNEVVEAPSICLPEVFAILPILKSGPAGLQSIIGPYLAADTFQENTCGRTCYQNFQYASHDFFYHCSADVNKTLSPVAAAMSVFQEFRNQACSKNSADKNCYALIASLIPTSADPREIPVAIESLEEAAEVGELAQVGEVQEVQEVEEVQGLTEEQLADPEEVRRRLQGVNLFDFTCQYTPSAAQNAQILAGVCGTLAPMGCCAATGITMVQQNQVKALSAAASGTPLDPTLFPPCLLQYLQSDACPVILDDYCTEGSIATTASLTGTFVVPRVATPPPPGIPFPNMYSKTSVLYLQGALSKVLNTFGFGVAPYFFSVAYPFKIQIIDFTYYSGDVALTPTDGGIYSPSQGDYTAATSANITFQLVMQDVNAATAAPLQAFIASPNFLLGLAVAFTGGYDTTNFTSAVGDAAVYDPVPLDVSKSSAYSASRAQWLLSLGVTAAASVVMGLSM